MEQEDIKTEAQEQTAARREWVTPTFERELLSEALGSGSPWYQRDGTYSSS